MLITFIIVSQIFYLGLSFNFMQKKRVDLVDLFRHNFLHLIKQKLRLETSFPPYECGLRVFKISCF